MDITKFAFIIYTSLMFYLLWISVAGIWVSPHVCILDSSWSSAIICFVSFTVRQTLPCVAKVPSGTHHSQGQELVKRSQSIQVAKATRGGRNSRRKTEVLIFCQFPVLALADPLAISLLIHTRCVPEHSRLGLTLRTSFTPLSSQESRCHTAASPLVLPQPQPCP